MRCRRATSHTEVHGDAGELAGAVRLQRVVLDVLTRTLGPEYPATLVPASYLAASLSPLRECAEAAVLLWTMLAVETRTLGADDMDTLMRQRATSSAYCSIWESTQKRRHLAGGRSRSSDAPSVATTARRSPRWQLGGLALRARQYGHYIARTSHTRFLRCEQIPRFGVLEGYSKTFLTDHSEWKAPVVQSRTCAMSL